MLTSNRIESFSEPPVFVNLGTGYYYYNYDIRYEGTRPFPSVESEDSQEMPVYTYLQVRINGMPEYKKCVDAIIRQYITQNQEFDLINSFNKVALNLIDTEDEALEANNKYLEYLELLKTIKTNVKKDFK